MRNGDILLLKADDVLSLLSGRELETIDTVRAAYEAHGDGESSLPFSEFLRFPGNTTDRIIALPAYLGDQFQVAGIKWIASFPDNLTKGLDRASAVLILNSTETGRPEAIIEGSVISAQRTAASAALAALKLHDISRGPNFGLIGCGLINFEIMRFVLTAFPEIKTLKAFDMREEAAKNFIERGSALFENVRITQASDAESVLRDCQLIAIATTAITPHIKGLSMCSPGTTLLHISLRDLSPESILSSENVVDDINHVCRAQTSVHLAEQLTGNRDFIRCALSDILRGKEPGRQDADSVAVFSPFGLGVLDLSVGNLVRNLALEMERGTIINSFLPPARSERQ